MDTKIRVKAMTKIDPGEAFEARTRRFCRDHGLVGKALARALRIAPVTAARRLLDDPLERREMKVSELGRIIAENANSFFEQVWRPTFETPDEHLESLIDELQDELARRRAANPHRGSQPADLVVDRGR
jgi:hypothetical protein